MISPLKLCKLYGCAGFDLVEFMPERDVDGIGALTAGRIVVNVLGALARQHLTG